MKKRKEDISIQVKNDFFSATINYVTGKTTFWNIDGDRMFEAESINKDVFPLLISVYQIGHSHGHHSGFIEGQTKLQNELKNLLAI